MPRSLVKMWPELWQKYLEFMGFHISTGHSVPIWLIRFFAWIRRGLCPGVVARWKYLYSSCVMAFDILKRTVLRIFCTVIFVTSSLHLRTSKSQCLKSEGKLIYIYLRSCRKKGQLSLKLHSWFPILSSFRLVCFLILVWFVYLFEAFKKENRWVEPGEWSLRLLRWSVTLIEASQKILAKIDLLFIYLNVATIGIVILTMISHGIIP